MANKSIPQLDAITSLADSDLVHIVASNVDKKMTVANLRIALLGTDTAPVIYSATLTINSAAILTSNATPIQLIASAGAGKAIVVLGSTTIKSIFGSIAYATNTNVDIYTDTATEAQLFFQTLLNNTLTRTTMGNIINAPAAANTQIIADKGIYFRTQTGNPTAGDGSITINIQYIIIDL
jgi:hypothetical protein